MENVCLDLFAFAQSLDHLLEGTICVDHVRDELPLPLAVVPGDEVLKSLVADTSAGHGNSRDQIAA